METGMRSEQARASVGPSIERCEVGAFTIPTDGPESDGTLEWDSTTLIVVHTSAAGATGIGYTYAHTAAADLIHRTLGPLITGQNALNVEAGYVAMVNAIRNLGRPGVASAAISAVDMAIWDLKARLLQLPLISLLGAARDAISIYGSGGFTSYSTERLRLQLGGWIAEGFPAVKMKVGRDPRADRERVRIAREAIGPDAELFVDANGAYSRKLALAQAEVFGQEQVSWFEEPVSSDDLEGLRLLRDRAPAGMDIAAGEYGYDIWYFRAMAAAEAVDVLQLDATRCGGVTGFMRAHAVCDAFFLPMSSHTAPTVHAHLCCAASRARHLEYFYDHARIEHMLFDGALGPNGGAIAPDLSRPGLGIEFKHADARRFGV